MRVVHVASGREWRGGQRQTWLLARTLAGRGLEQAVVTGRGTELARRLAADGIPVRPAAWRLGLDPRVLPTLFRAISEPDTVVHAHDPHAMALAGWACRRSHTPLVVTRRTVFPLQQPALWRRAARVVAISSAVRDQLITDGLSPDRLVVVPSAVDLASIARTKAEDLRRRLGLPDGTPLVITVAALTPEKGHEIILRAAQRLPSVHWVWVGDGRLRTRLEAERRLLGLDGRVHLMGQVDDPLPLVAAADLALLPSRQEGLGVAALEAMALGIPVVASAVGGLAELLRGEAGILVPPDDPAAVARAVQEILEQPVLRAALVQCGSARAAQFGPETMADAMTSVYRSVVQSLEDA